MSIQTKIEAGRLSFNLYDLLGELTDDERASLIDTLAVREEVINEVANQLIDGMTSMGSYGPQHFGGEPKAVYGLDGARLRIAKASGAIAARELERMAEAMARLEKSRNDAWQELNDLKYGRSFA